MKKIFYSIIIICSMLFLLPSCSSDFLELTDPNTIAPSEFPKNMTDMNLLIDAVYADQHSRGLFGHEILGKAFYCVDHTWELQYRNFLYWIDIAQNFTKPSNEFMRNLWRDSYRGIQHCNNILEILPEYKNKYAKEGDIAKLGTIEGEAYFMRAWFYYYLIGFFGESFIVDGQFGDKMGVPIITSRAKTYEEMIVPRNTVQEVWTQIIDDLKKSETLLNQYPSSDKTRVSVWAARGFLGKVYAFTGNWNEAKPILKNVIDNSGKKLVPFNVYSNMFNGENEFNSESLYEINFVTDKTHTGIWNINTGSEAPLLFAATYMTDNGGKTGAGYSNGYVHDKTQQRFGFNLTYTMIPNPDFDESKPESKDNLKTICDPEYLKESARLREQKLVDPRLWVGALQPYVDYITVGGQKRLVVKYKGMFGNEQAWSLKKFVDLKQSEYENSISNGSNVYWLRLADIYLLYAEACMKTGDNVNSLEYINKVKRRAYDYPVDSPSPVDYASLTAKTMASDPVLMNNPLRYERFTELYAEANWWFDVCRWKIGDQEAKYYETAAGGAIQWDNARSYAQPIPLAETGSNKAMIQNPGY